MKRITLYIVPLLLLSLTACTDDLGVDFASQAGINYRGEPVDAFLDISVGTLSISMQTRADEEYDPYEDTEAERWVSDMWIFQYDAEEETLIADPIYLTITDQKTLTNVPAVLSDNNGDPTLIYVVTNTSNETWANNIEVTKVEDLLAAALPTREPILVRASELEAMSDDGLSIPMEGNSGEVTVVKNKLITVPVARMYAKVMIDPDLELTSSEIYSVGIGNIPQYCQVRTLYENDDDAATYPETVVWISRTFTSLEEEDTAPGEQEPDAGTDTDTDLGYRYIAYVPENIEGQDVDKSMVGKEDDKGETVTAPARAFQVNIVIAHTDDEGGVTNYPYTVYPGADTETDYNIKRNNVYRVKVKINTLSVARVPSANCLFGFAGTTISFFPYYRVETGGGYDFTDYLDPNGAEDAQTDRGAKIDHVGIVWQTKDCIGDNTNGDLVYLSTNSTTHTGYEQIYVKTQKEGNALIAAYDTEDNIIWSWHIWVRDPKYSDPTNLSNAKTYYTYYWDEQYIYSYALNDTAGIYHDRVSGYQIMSCNLGALQDEPNFNFNGFWNKHTQSEKEPQYLQDGDEIVRTYGMLYQWGRKDPFPPMIKAEGAIGNNSTGFNTGYYVHDYDDAHTDVHYGNDNKTVVHKTAYGPEGPSYKGATTKYDDYLFYTHIHTGVNTSTGVEGDEGTDVISGMRYSIAHPTVFLCGVEDIARTLTCSADNNFFISGSNTTSTVRSDSTEYVKHIGNYIWGGAWSNEDHDDREWGGLRPDASSEKYLDLGITDDAGNSIKLWDDYESGTDGAKSIFDPCPYGWRVGSSDLWLGFTKNGVNPYYDYKDNVNKAGELDNINYDSIHSCILGMYMYLGTENNNDWCKGDLSWFPTQGFRLPDGCGYRVGGCGNYVNANTDENERINIIHIHDDVQYFKQFEVQVHYTRKSTGNPLRCVRDTK